MNNIKYHLDLGSTSACTKKIMEATKGFVQRDVNLSNNDFFLFGGWFSSKRFAEALMYVVSEIIGIIKINTKYCVRISSII